MLAEAGTDVVVIDTHDVGWGASGRNAGQVIAGLKRDPHEVIRILGQDAGERLLRLSSDAPARYAMAMPSPDAMSGLLV